ncbi:tape measure protein [Neoaquamicrobium microcysteis]|nr:tape measure protein [Mesorhizobium microcysteis]
MAAQDLERLVVQLSADFKQFERQMSRAAGVTNRQFRAIEDRARQLNRNLDGIFMGMGRSIIAPLGGVAAALGTREILRMADTWTELKSRVDLAAGSIENGEAVMGRLSEMARRTYSGLEQTAEGWLSNATALRELGMSTSRQLDLVETLNNALVISAAKGQRAESVMSAWAKAMALGELRGDNLNTVIQSGGRLAQALADSMGVSVSSLRTLGQQGKITTRDMAGVTSELEKLRKEADSMPATIGDAMQLLRDAMLQYVGGADQAAGASAALAEKIILLADNFTGVADTALQFATIVISALTGRAIGGLVKALPVATTSVMALVTAMRAGTLTATGFAAALGPMGLLLGAAAATLYMVSQRQGEADQAAEQHRLTVVQLRDEIANLDYANHDAVASTRTKIAADLKAAEVALERAQAEYQLAEALQATIDQRATPSTARTYTGFGVDTSKVPLGGQDVVAQNIVAGQRDITAEKVERMRERVEEIKALSAEFDDYASGRRTPPPRGERLPSTLPANGKGKSTKDRADEYQRLAERIREATASLVAETEVQRQLNPLIDDYGYAIERARVEHELLNAAKKAGVPITAELRGEIANLAEQYAVATVEAAKLAEEQNRARENAEHWLGVGQNVTKGFIDDLIRGTSAAGAFANAISKIGDALINDVLSNIFKINQAGSGGILGSIIGLIGGSIGGGVRLPGMAPIPTPRPMLGASMAAPMSSPVQAPTMPNLSAMKAAAKPQELRVLVVAEEGPMLRPVISATSRDVAVKVTQVGLHEFSRGAGRAMVLDVIEDPRKRG